MKAMLVNENSDLVWSDVADPVIKDDEVLIKIYAAALNRADLLQRKGQYPSPAGCPEWMGLEVAGIITEYISPRSPFFICSKVRITAGL